ncbi:MAG: methyltransferase [Solirubrobacterales bacterium]|nr:methyltransferase [Solirubrobacterales bacterium]
MDFCGLRIRVAPGVYVPRFQSELLARGAAARLRAGGTAIDLCTGSGAIARFLADAHPSARVVATDADEAAVACARSNGVEAYTGDLFAPLPDGLSADVVVGVLPYVPTPDLPLLHRDTLTFESPLAYDGGPDGLAYVRRAVQEAPSWMRPGAALLLELGAEQPEALAADLAAGGFTEVVVLRDEDGDVRGVESTYAG